MYPIARHMVKEATLFGRRSPTVWLCAAMTLQLGACTSGTVTSPERLQEERTAYVVAVTVPDTTAMSRGAPVILHLQLGGCVEFMRLEHNWAAPNELIIRPVIAEATDPCLPFSVVSPKSFELPELPPGTFQVRVLSSDAVISLSVYVGRGAHHAERHSILVEGYRDRQPIHGVELLLLDMSQGSGFVPVIAADTTDSLGQAEFDLACGILPESYMITSPHMGGIYFQDGGASCGSPRRTILRFF